MQVNTKAHSGIITNTKEDVRNGVKVGIIEGYIATWDADRGKDVFVKGAFADAIQRHKDNNNRQVRFKDHHGKTIGGFPIDGVFEDERGLFGTAEVNLEMSQGKDAYSLAKQGVLTDFSVGWWSVPQDFFVKDGFTFITKSELWEGSIVDEPMNPHANITAVKGMKKLTVVDAEWDASSAKARIDVFLKDNEALSYKSAYLVHGEDDKSVKGFKFLIADIVDGKMVAVKSAINEAEDTLQAVENEDIKLMAERGLKLYQNNLITIDDLIDIKSKKELEKLLKKVGFSKSAATKVANWNSQSESDDDNSNLQSESEKSELNEINNSLSLMNISLKLNSIIK